MRHTDTRVRNKPAFITGSLIPFPRSEGMGTGEVLVGVEGTGRRGDGVPLAVVGR